MLDCNVGIHFIMSLSKGRNDISSYKIIADGSDRRP